MWQELARIWDYSVVVIDTEPITVGKIVISLLIFLVGIILAGRVVRLISRRLTRYTHLQETNALLIDKMLRYSLYALVALFALRIVNIPLGVFAFLGGAIAIGVGFGAQNLINNFISGFILMTERPISVGDLVEIEGVVGRVEEIGGRSTRIRTGENIHILVPNSSFLEKNIVNWTLADNSIRTHIRVGVIYGSPTRRVEELLLQAATESPAALEGHERFVLFQDFGDNALIFDLFFWIRVASVIERRRIESQVRFRIDELCRQNGIVIAFPQRDVHLDAAEPLRVRLEGGGGDEAPRA